MGRKRTVVAEPPPRDEAADEEGFDEAPEFDFDNTPETHDANDEKVHAY